MDASLLSQMQSQEAATDDDEAALNARLEAHSMDLHTALPGHVVSYDAATQTAVCQPGIQVIFRATGPVDLPQLVDVPVYFPRGGGFVLTFPVRVGDECLLVFAERAIDVWWQKGGTQVPAEYRTHDLSDAFALVGFQSVPGAQQVVGGASGSAVELRALDGTSKVSLGNDGSVTVTSKSGKDVSVNAGKNANVNGTLVCLNTAAAAPPVPSLPDLAKAALPFTVPAGGAANGVVLASDFCAFTGMPHGAHGCGSSTVVAGK